MKQFQRMFWISTIVALTAIMSCLATMMWAVDLPPDEYTLLRTRWLNWPDRECYTKENIELLIEGPNQITLEDYEQNKETYISSIKGKLIRFTR